MKCIIFDMDGVLLDSRKAWFHIFNDTLEHFESRKIPEEEFNEKVWAKNFSETSKDYFSKSKEDIFPYLYGRYTKFSKHFLKMDDVEEIFKQIQNLKLKIAVATNTNNSQAKKMLENIGLSNYVDYLVGGDDVKQGKPEPDMLLKLLKDLELNREDVIFIGDTIWDQKAAVKAGIDFIGFKLVAEKTINSLKEVLDIIK